MKRTFLPLALTALLFTNRAEAQTVITSPKGHNAITIAQHDDEFFYTMSRNGQPIVTDSHLGLDRRLGHLTAPWHHPSYTAIRFIHIYKERR